MSLAINKSYICIATILPNSKQELYFDSNSQIRMSTWYLGRIALIGDACFAPSLVSGQGLSFAMTSAYLMAGELKLANGRFDIAFAN